MVLTVTAPIFLLILLGYLGARFQLIPLTAVPALGRFVLYFALPALIFTKLQSVPLNQLVNLDYMLIYGGAGCLSLLLAIAASRYVLRDNWQRAGVIGLGACMPNSSFIGFPLLLQLFDEAPTQAFVMVLLVENILLMPLSLILIESFSQQGRQPMGDKLLALIKRLLSHPIIVAVILGLSVSYFALPLPDFLLQSASLLGASAAPLALIVIGGGLVGVTLTGQVPGLALVASMKLVCYPLLVFCLLLLAPPMAQELKIALLLFSAMPMLSIYPIIGGQYQAASFAASALLITTLLSFITINLLLSVII